MLKPMELEPICIEESCTVEDDTDALYAAVFAIPMLAKYIGEKMMEKGYMQHVVDRENKTIKVRAYVVPWEQLDNGGNSSQEET